MEFIINHTDEILVSHSGLALAGAVLKQSPLRKRLNEICLGKRKRPEIPHGDVLMSMIGPAVPGQERLCGHRDLPPRGVFFVERWG